ncbi:oocyte zinc finger protein XlCOF6 [Chanos chanos]|uniref:Oocyte zinc finger protein XlCOF6 n=1 Tax=Chanos chanos TaxID=29144 RepID=A0A6J2WMV0_CHACN|nr:oocyte zinc finger protein XlCOF6-like [Chanos chanos]
MSAISTFQTQLVSIMDTLAKTAVLEISKLVDIEYKVLRFEVTRSRQEIRTLQGKLQLMENMLQDYRAQRQGTGEDGGPEMRKIPDPCSAEYQLRRDVLSEIKREIVSEEVSKASEDFATHEGATEEFLLTGQDKRLSVSKTLRTRTVGTLSGDKRFVCTYCAKRFKCFSQLEIHQRSHTGEKPFKCMLCGKRYAQRGHLYTHQRTHTGEKPYRCLQCGKGFIQKCRTVAQKTTVNCHHSRSQFGGGSKGIEGQMMPSNNISGSASVTQSQTDSFVTYAITSDNQVGQSTQHRGPDSISTATLPTTHGDNTSEPNLDSEEFVRLYPNTINFNPMQNQRSPRGDKKFECVFCGKSFTYLGYLKVHLRQHSGEKPFACTMCGKRFARKTYLKLHQRTHSGEKPYTCMECGKSFSQKSSLNVHLRTHTGEKPFNCVECGKSYTHKHGFNKHQCIS